MIARPSIRPGPAWRAAVGLILIAASLLAGRAAVDTTALQQSLDQGRAADVLNTLTDALRLDPENPHLLYNRAVAAYAARRYDDALIDLDLVEGSRHRGLANKARFQKGNTEFQLGLAKQAADVEATVALWKQSLASYEGLLKEQPGHTNGRKNHDRVRQLLLDLLLKLGRENLEKGQEAARPKEERIAPLRAAMEQFHDAVEMEPQNEPAKEGEAKARELLAQMLAEEGTRKTMANQYVMPGPNEPMIPRPDLGQIQEGVNMLEDAKDLQPRDQNIAKQLEAGRERLADALVKQAQMYQAVELRMTRNDEKQAILRLAMEGLNRALEQVPEHQKAKETLEQVKQRLAQLHEQQGDQLAQQAEQGDLEQQAQDLSQALDHFQQASELQPQQSQLPRKAQQAQAKLEDALQKLANRLMQPRPGESQEEQAARLEGALQALNELQGLKPSPQTSEQARQVGGMLEALRQMMAMGKRPGGPRQNPNAPPEPPRANDPDTTVAPMDAPPRLDTPGARGRYRSSALNRSLRDY